MQIEVGLIYEGKVTGITKFGAFVDIGEGKSGMVHISEVANSYVKDINDVLKLGDNVRVKLVAINPDGKLSLSIKQADGNAEEKPSRKEKGRGGYRTRQPREKYQSSGRPGDYEWRPSENSGGSFEDMMSRFKKQSDDKLSDFKRANGENRKSRKGDR